MKTQDSTGFWADHKLMISVIALLIALGNLVWSFVNQKEQNSRWEMLNAPNPQIKNAELISIKELPLSEANQTKWGYNQKYYAKNGTTNIVVLYYILIAKDSLNRIIENINPVFTIPEIVNELKRISFKGPYSIHKKYRPSFTIENMGRTETKNLSIKIDAKFPGLDWQNVFKDLTKINLAIGQSSSMTYDLYVPVNDELPEKIEYRISLNYKGIDNRLIYKEINTKWESTNNLWTFQ